MLLKKLYIIFLLILTPLNKTLSLENKILFFIDNQIVTSLDVLNELQYLKVVNLNLSELDKNTSIEVAKNSLISEIIKKNEILKYTDSIVVDDVYLEESLKKIYKNIGFETIDEFDNYLKKSDVNLIKIKEKISIEIFWKELIYTKFSNQVVINREEIEKDLKKLQNKLTNEYLLSELIFNIQNAGKLDSKLELIKGDILKKGFKNATLIHSIADSAKKNNGQIGWINEASINQNIRKIIKDLAVGEHTDPISIPGGYLILKIDDLRKVKNDKINLNDEINKIVFNKTNEQLNNFSNIYFNKIKKEFSISEK